MKNILKELLSTIVILAALLLVIGLANILVEITTNIITMDMIMTVVYVTLGFSFIYILRN